MPDNNRVKLTTPRGVLRYPALDRPDTKFNPEGRYRAPIVLDGNDPAVQAFAEKVEALLQKAYDEAVAKLKAEKKAGLAREVTINNPLKPDIDPETGEETGYLIMKPEMRASGTKKDGTPWKQTLPVFDAKGRRLPKAPQAYTGTVAKVSVTMEPNLHTAKKQIVASLRLSAVQILELKQGGARDATDYGFGAEDGYEIDEDSGYDSEDFSDGSSSDGGGSSYNDI